jgi:soluble lytic murein transglycosylase
MMIAILFVPAFLAHLHFPQELNEPLRELTIQPRAEKPKPRELVKIFSILKSHRPDISEHEAWAVSDAILEQSAKHNFDPMLVLAMIEVESGFQYAVVSPSGARGIMQLLPDVAKSVLDEISSPYESKNRPFRPEALDDPVLNIKLGVSYLHSLRKSFRNLQLALLAYNAGPTEIRNRLDNDMELSDEYSSAVLNKYQRYKSAKPPIF